MSFKHYKTVVGLPFHPNPNDPREFIDELDNLVGRCPCPEDTSFVCRQSQRIAELTRALQEIASGVLTHQQSILTASQVLGKCDDEAH